MTYTFLIITLHLFIIDYKSESSDPLHCWRCEVTTQSSNHTELLLDNCDADFDFTQHTREQCDGKCWKSVDLVQTKTFNNDTRSIFALVMKVRSLSKLKSSRRCFTASELVRAAEMGVNTSDGCQQIRKNDRKVKEVCFCSDEDMCNDGLICTNNFYVLFIAFFYLYFK